MHIFELECLEKLLFDLCMISEKLVFWGLLLRVRLPKRKTTEAQRARRKGANTASVPSVPLWFKNFDET